MGTLRKKNNNQRLPIRVLERVAHQFATKFPKTFQDTLRNGQKVGTGYSKILSSLVERNNYTNRIGNKKTLRAKLGIKVQHLRYVKLVEVGCRQWQPEFYPEGEDDNSLEEKRIYLLDFEEKFPLDEDYSKNVVDYFIKTFCLQRMFLNNPVNKPNIENVKENWPDLLNPYLILRHYCHLMELMNLDSIWNNLRSTVSLLLSLGQVQDELQIQNDASNYEKFYESLRLICLQFKENLEHVIVKCPVSLLYKLLRINKSNIKF